MKKEKRRKEEEEKKRQNEIEDDCYYISQIYSYIQIIIFWGVLINFFL